ncbi:hypothetical protein PWT90_06597 [Aphanocladium album]|nr:hypothetical protein PWT90_06597 [Aphanocladium album]
MDRQRRKTALSHTPRSFEKELELDSIKAIEKWNYHSVSHRGTDEVGIYSPLSYTSTVLPEPHNLKFEDYCQFTALARAIPQDGRIELASDLRWLIQQARHDWELQVVYGEETAEYGRRVKGHDILFRDDKAMVELLGKNSCNTNDGSVLVQYIRAKQEEKIKHLESFFNTDFRLYGSFTVRDINPDASCQVLYNMGGRAPYAAIKGKTERESLTIAGAPSTSYWLTTQKQFCPGNPSVSQIAPWQRIILCEGLSLASPKAKELGCFPFLAFDEDDDPIRMAANLHLSGERRAGSESSNPYSNSHNAFHITFFERLQHHALPSGDRSTELGRDLKIGHLYDRSRDPYFNNRTLPELKFRQSSFTVITAIKPIQKLDEFVLSESERYWTMIILSPTAFFAAPPLFGDKTWPDWGIAVGKASHRVAELSCILSGLRKVENCWREFNEYMGSLLVEDFMNPPEYSKLLFDDATFSRSRLYFWILGCLNEFDVLLEDNIKQWRLYRRVRIEPLLPKPTFNSQDALDALAQQANFRAGRGDDESFSTRGCARHIDLLRLQKLDAETENVRQGLEYLRAEFKAKQIKVQGLRDGLFNASALMESRSSTRLGMNVQLLTYVSIFYLPLAFCAALWAIPNITDGGTRSPFIATAILVGAATYAIVFNLENIAGFFGELYQGRKERLLHGMKNDSKEFWHDVGDRFEEFPPSEERKPSEWWLLRYAVSSLFRRVGAKSSNDNKGDA